MAGDIYVMSAILPGGPPLDPNTRYSLYANYGLVEGNHATYPMVPIDVAPGGYMDISDK